MEEETVPLIHEEIMQGSCILNRNIKHNLNNVYTIL